MEGHKSNRYVIILADWLSCVGNLRAWRGDKLRQFPELRFTYEEEASPEDFFVPMVWSLVVAHTSVPWDPQVGLPARFLRCMGQCQVGKLRVQLPCKKLRPVGGISCWRVRYAQHT